MDDIQPIAPHSEVPTTSQGRARAVAAVAVVFVIGIALGFVFRGPSVPEVEIVLSDHSGGGPQGPIISGPNGFVRPAADSFEFSPDGQTWTPFELARGLEDARPLRDIGSLQLQATDTVWMIEGTCCRRDGVWVSADGQAWTRVKWEEPLDSTMTQVIATGPGFLGGATTDDVRTEFWSTDGVAWAPASLPPEGSPDRFWSPTVSGSGIVFMGTGDDRIVELRHSADGQTWTVSSIDFNTASSNIENVALGSINHVSGHWVFTTNISEDGEWAAHVWTSEDFADWQYRGHPAFAKRANGPRAIGLVYDIDELLVMSPVASAAPGGTGSSKELWATSDGKTWTQVSKDLAEHQYLAGRKNADDTYTIVYAK